MNKEQEEAHAMTAHIAGLRERGVRCSDPVVDADGVVHVTVVLPRPLDNVDIVFTVDG